jgi:hypothetical protein
VGGMAQKSLNVKLLMNCGAIATSVANLCRVDFSGSDHGKPLLRRVWLIPNNFNTEQFRHSRRACAYHLALPVIPLTG